MVPFCRSLGEARRVLAALAAQGLARDAAGGTAGGVPVWMMCEIPNNVLLIDEFAPLFDGISIGSNDLTQLVLGVDRDSALVASAFDECDPGVLKMLRQAIEGAHRCGRPSGICGQAPSDHPELLRLLVAWGIDSLSVTPDRLLATVRAVAQAEAEARAGVAAQSTVAPLALTTAS
jgi:pyruvate,water dikinase